MRFQPSYNQSFTHPYSFQAQEHDDEVKGDGNSVNYKYRMHDPRLGRFFAIDPMAPKYPRNSPYSFSENRVIDCIELEGLEIFKIDDGINSTNGSPIKVLTVIDVYSEFKIIDEMGKQIPNFKYSKFDEIMCKHEYYTDASVSGGIGPNLYVPNKSGQKLFNQISQNGDENGFVNFEIGIDDFSLLGTTTADVEKISPFDAKINEDVTSQKFTAGESSTGKVRYELVWTYDLIGDYNSSVVVKNSKGEEIANSTELSYVEALRFTLDASEEFTINVDRGTSFKKYGVNSSFTISGSEIGSEKVEVETVCTE